MKDKVLDKFLFECKKSANHFQARNDTQRNRKTNIYCHQTKEISPYADPNNWVPRRIVGLYQGSIHASTFLGNFVEYTFRDARRLRDLRYSLQGLSPSQSETLAGLPRSTEILPAFGREPVSRADTESEVRALTERFHELMGEFSLNHSGVL